MWEWMGHMILEYGADILMDVFRWSPLYPEEWSLLRVMNAFLAGCALIFLLTAGTLGWAPSWIAGALLVISGVTRLVVRKILE